MSRALIHDDLFRRLCRARDFLHENHASPITLDDMARRAHLSRYHFLRLFRDTFGATPHQYLIGIRLARARTLLGEERGTVTDICFEVGFESLGSFSTLFAERVGCPPGAWRRRVWRLQGEPFGVARLVIPCCFWNRVTGVSLGTIEGPAATRS